MNELTRHSYYCICEKCVPELYPDYTEEDKIQFTREEIEDGYQELKRRVFRTAIQEEME